MSSQDQGKKSWSQLFINSLAAQGIGLQFIVLEVEENGPVARLKAQEIRKMEQIWDNAIMLFTPDKRIETHNIQWLAKAQWPKSK